MQGENDHPPVSTLSRKNWQQIVKAGGYSAVFILTDANSERYCLPLFRKLTGADKKCTVILIKAGEENKTIETCTQIWDQLEKHDAGRDTLIVNLGGGTLCDTGGFAASVYLRGIDFIQVPTTLLAMVDASVGGKTGVNFRTYKNHLGTFRMPVAILTEPGFLKTLPQAQLEQGLVEMVKHALIADGALWKQIRKAKSHDELIAMLVSEEGISRSQQTKLNVIESDWFESGSRMLLNYGHTVGHAFETFFMKKKVIPHGDAVAAGMICESFIAYARGVHTLNNLGDVSSFIASHFNLPVIRTGDIKTILAILPKDKKKAQNRLRIGVPSAPGKGCILTDVTPKEFRDALSFYCYLLDDIQGK